MTERIEGAYRQTQVAQDAYVKDVRSSEGSYRGEKIKEKLDIQSLIADAAEELTFGASEKVEKDLSKRKVSSKKSEFEKVRERLEMYLRKVPDFGSLDKLNQFIEHLKKSKFSSREQLLKETDKYFKDITHKFLALTYVLDVFKEEGEKDLADVLEKTVSYLSKEHSEDIRAGLNISETAQDFSSKGLGEIQELRDFYRENIVKYDGLHALHSSLLQNFSEDDFDNAVSFLIEAAGNDLRSQEPSVSPAHLKEVMDDLYRLEVIGNFHRDCASLIEKTEKLYSVKVSISAAQLADKVLALKEEKWIVSSRVEELLNSSLPGDIEARIFFLTNLKELVRAIPLKAFSDQEDRDKFLSVMQEALDSVIEAEEG